VDLQDLIKSILCRECNNPETKLRLKSNGNSLSMKCAACGHRSVIKHQDIVFDEIISLFKNRTAKKKELKKRNLKKSLILTKKSKYNSN